MYGYGYSYGYGLIGGNTYNPLINYDWSTTTASGLRYLKDIGSTPTYNASMYFGRGAYLNGVDQTIPINTISLAGDCTISFTSNTDGLNQRILFGTNVGIANFIRFEATSITYRVNNIEYSFPFLGSANTIASYVFKRVGTLTTLYVNGVSIVSKTIPISTIIFDKVGTSAGIQYFKGTLKDVYMFNRALNQSEITQAYEQSEAFYAMAQADSTCVLNMPMCETDGYVRNMKSYSEGVDLITNGTFDTNFNGWTDSSSAILTVVNGRCRIETPLNDSAGAITRVVSGLTIGKTYAFKYNAESPSLGGGVGVKVSSEGGNWDLYNGPYIVQKTPMDTIVTFVPTTTSITIYLYSTGLGVDGQYAYYDNVSIKEVTGIYPITNYTASVRDNAKNLQYGLQTCKFVRDSLGVIQGASDYLECDGSGYGNTGWIPDINKDETLEIIFDSSKDAIELNGCEFAKGFGVGSYEGTPNRAYVKVHGSATKTFSTLTAISLLTIPYNATTQTFDIYSNEVLLYENIAITAIDNTIKTFKIGNREGVLPVTTPIRLFKVHNKELTQAEITANYNSYVAKGLLS